MRIQTKLKESTEIYYNNAGTKTIIPSRIDSSSLTALNAPYFKVEIFVFPDIKTESWYYPFVKISKENGIISGFKDGTFRPSNNITGVEAAKIIDLLLKQESQ